METAGNDAKQVAVTNRHDSQALQFSLRVLGPANGFVITLPDASEIKSDKKLENGQFIICKGEQAYLADKFRKKIADLAMDHAVLLPKGESKIGVRFPGTEESAKLRFELTAWTSGKGEVVGK